MFINKQYRPTRRQNSIAYRYPYVLELGLGQARPCTNVRCHCQVNFHVLVVLHGLLTFDGNETREMKSI